MARMRLLGRLTLRMTLMSDTAAVRPRVSTTCLLDVSTTSSVGGHAASSKAMLFLPPTFCHNLPAVLSVFSICELSPSEQYQFLGEWLPLPVYGIIMG